MICGWFYPIIVVNPNPPGAGMDTFLVYYVIKPGENRVKKSGLHAQGLGFESTSKVEPCLALDLLCDLVNYIIGGGPFRHTIW